MRHLLIVIALLSPLHLSAQTAGFPSLRLSGSARPAGMADLSAALQGPEAANPAALSATTQRAYAFSHNAWIGDIEQQHLHAVKQGAHSAWALRAQIWQADGLEYRTGPSSQPLGTFGAYDLAAGVVYARRLSSEMRLGAQLKLLHQSISTHSAVGYGVDVFAKLCQLQITARVKANQIARHLPARPLGRRINAQLVGGQRRAEECDE